MTDNQYNPEYVPLENSQGHKYLGKLCKEEKNWLGRINARIYQCYNMIGDKPFGYLAVYKGISGPIYMNKGEADDMCIKTAVRRAKTVYRGRQNAKRQATRQSRTR